MAATPDPFGQTLMQEIDMEAGKISKEKEAALRYDQEMEKLKKL